MTDVRLIEEACPKSEKKKVSEFLSEMQKQYKDFQNKECSALNL